MALFVRVRLNKEQQEMARAGINPNDFGFTKDFQDTIAQFKPFSGIQFDGEYMVLEMGFSR